MSDDLDDNLELDESSFDEFDNKEETLGDLWRNNPAVKIGVIAGAAVLLIAVIVIFGGSKKDLDPSFVPAGSQIKAPPGTEEVSSVYAEAVKEESEARIEEAFKGGGSALPTPIDPPVGRLGVEDDGLGDEDPLQRWRKLQEERLQRELEQQQSASDSSGLDGDGLDQGIQPLSAQALSDIMSQQMQAILESQSQESLLGYMSITDPSCLDQLAEEERRAAEAAAVAAGQTIGPDGSIISSDGTVIQEVIVPAGQIAYSQLLNEANSDVPGPVLAQIVSGPLAGSRALGTFEVQDEYLTLTFTTVVVDGISQTINAVALDPDTSLPGMATEVDHRYIRRVIIPMAAAFVEGAANAISESGLTTVTVQGETVAEETNETDAEQEIASGIEEAGQELRDILDDMAANIQILVRIEAGTPFGMLFLEPVLENPGTGSGDISE